MRQYDIRRSKVDGVYRLWKRMTYDDLGLERLPTWNPPIWVCVGTAKSFTQARQLIPSR